MFSSLEDARSDGPRSSPLAVSTFTNGCIHGAGMGTLMTLWRPPSRRRGSKRGAEGEVGSLQVILDVITSLLETNTELIFPPQRSGYRMQSWVVVVLGFSLYFLVTSCLIQLVLITVVTFILKDGKTQIICEKIELLCFLETTNRS